MKSHLEVKDVSPYLPYKLHVLRPDRRAVLEVFGIEGNNYLFDEDGKEEATYGLIPSRLNKPLLYPMTDLIEKKKIVDLQRVVKPDFKEGKITHYGYFRESLQNLYCVNCHLEDAQVNYRGFYVPFDANLMSVNMYNKLLEWNFDLFGLIEKGLAEDASKYLGEIECEYYKQQRDE